MPQYNIQGNDKRKKKSLFCLLLFKNVTKRSTQLYLINVIFKLESKELKRISLLKTYHLVIQVKSLGDFAQSDQKEALCSWESSHSKSWGTKCKAHLTKYTS